MMVLKASTVPGAAFLRLALLPHRIAMLEAVREASFARSEHLEFVVTGVPDVARVALFVWPEPLGKTKRLAVDVVRLDGRVLSEPVSLTFELEPDERPAVPDEPVPPRGDPRSINCATFPADRRDVLVFAGPLFVVEWRLVEEPGMEREVLRLDRLGRPVYGMVDTTDYCYRLACRCGRVRYSKPNSVHQVSACRVCTRTDQLRRRALKQYQARHGKRRR